MHNANAMPPSNDLVAGWLTTQVNREANTIHETQYARRADGALFSCGPLTAPTPHFGRHRNGKPGTWVRCEALPDDAEWIGSYPMPQLPR